MQPTCPFDDTTLSTDMHDADGYTMFICPKCDVRFRADAWVSRSAVPHARAGDTIIMSTEANISPELMHKIQEAWAERHGEDGIKLDLVSGVKVDAIISSDADTP